MGFNQATRRLITPMPAINRPAGGGTTRTDIPRAGLLARIWLVIRGAALGTSITITGLHGKSDIIRRARLQGNNSQDLFNVSGAGYHWLLRDNLDFTGDPLGFTDARSAIASAATPGTNFDISMIVPLAVNLRDPLGITVLQSEQSLETLVLDWETDANLYTGTGVSFAAYSGGGSGVPTATPYLEIDTVPNTGNQADDPPLGMLHRCIEENPTVAGAGDYPYNWPRGGIILQMMHGMGFGLTSGAQTLPQEYGTRTKVRINQSTFLQDTANDYLDMIQNATRYVARRTGVYPIDFLGTDGLGSYNDPRDAVPTADLTDLATIMTLAAAAGQITYPYTFYALRRELIPA